MKNKTAMRFSVISLMVSLLHSIAAVIAILRLPETIPVHFNANWVCDGIGSRWVLLLVAVLPLIGAALLPLLMAAKPENEKVNRIFTLIIVLYLTAVFWMTYPAMASGAALGEQVDAQGFASLLPLLIAGMFTVLGNYMPVIQPNKNLGLRIGWTLHNPQCWRVTHRFAGKLWVVTGILMCLIVLIAMAAHHGGELWLYVIFGEFLLADMIAPCIYAWKHKDDGRKGEPHHA